MPQEMRTENPVVASVRGAIDNAGEDTKSFNQEYWQIRKELQGRLDWHGGGIYKMYVQNMDKITDVVWGGKNRSLGARIMEVKDKIWTRFSGAMIASSSAAADIIYNAGTWPFRLFLPIPKDVAKRFAIAGIFSNTVTAAAGGAALIVGKAGAEHVIESEKKYVRQVKATGEAIATGPEVAAIMVKRRAEKALYGILHPQDKKMPPGK